MLQKITFELDSSTIDLAKQYAIKKGRSLNELVEDYIRLFVLNEPAVFTSKESESTDFLHSSSENSELKQTNWDALNNKIAAYRKGLPTDYKFDRDEANER